MSRKRSTSLPPNTANNSATLEVAAPGERLSEDTTGTERLGVLQTKPEEETSDANVLWVDWDGPGDPMNPKKFVVRLLFV